jgi:hypothetical protein
MSKRSSLIGGGVLVAVITIGLLVALNVSGTKSGLTVSSATQPQPEGVGGISADAFTARGIFLGPPGQVPAGASSVSVATPLTTVAVDGSSSPPGPSGEQLAVQGDPANGTAQITASEAESAALANEAGFVGPTTTGDPVLLQYDDAPAGVVATAWAIPVTGTVQLSGGRAQTPLSGAPSTTPTSLPTEEAVIFIDAVTGSFISEEGFASN